MQLASMGLCFLLLEKGYVSVCECDVGLPRSPGKGTDRSEGHWSGPPILRGRLDETPKEWCSGKTLWDSGPQHPCYGPSDKVWFLR